MALANPYQQKLSAYLLAACQTQLCDQDSRPKHAQTYTLHVLPGAFVRAVVKTLHVSVFHGHQWFRFILRYRQAIPIHTSL